MSTNPLDVLTTTTTTSTGAMVAALLAAGLSLSLGAAAAYALGYTPLGGVGGAPSTGADGDASASAGVSKRGDMDVHTGTGTETGVDKGKGKSKSRRAEEKRPADSSGVRKARKRKGRAGTGTGTGEGEGEGEGESGTAPTSPLRRVVPGDFGLDSGGADASAGGAPLAGAISSSKAQKKRGKKRQGQGQKQKQKQDEEGEDAGSETGREVLGVGRAPARSGDHSTDVSVSLAPSVSGGAPQGRGGPAAPSDQLRETRPSSSSLDTDSSWTHVGRRHLLKMSKPADATSSDLASTASGSPVAERMDSATMDMHEARADLAQRTLAETVPTPGRAGIDDMLGEPDRPSLARVMRVQPPADETPVPGFSWEDYGDVIEDSLLAHDADEEDEGEWGVVKSRGRARTVQTTGTTASTSASPSAPQEAMTKKQRQNARRRELTKAAKAETETARLQGLAKHKRELERLRMIEQSQGGGGKQPSGGMRATVDDQGKLVWE